MVLQLEDLHARTVSSEGQSTVSDAAVYDKEIVRAKRYKLNAKTLTPSNVRVGRDGNAIRIARAFMLGGNYFPVEQYAALKNFYQQAVTAEDAQISLLNVQRETLRPYNNSCPSGKTCVLFVAGCASRAALSNPQP